MKNLRIAKMVSVFSKRSMLACMIAGGMLSLNSCDNKSNLEPSQVSTFQPTPGDVINSSGLDDIAKALAASMGEESVRTLIKTEALKKFDGDFDILYQNIDDKNVGGKTLNAVLNENGSKNGAARKTSIAQLASQIPLLNISVPVNIEKWNTGSFEPLVVISPSSFVKDEMKLTTVKAYDKNGKVHYLDAKKAPDFPVIVVGLNERTTFKNGKFELKTNLAFPKKPSGARSNYEEIYDPGNGGGYGGGGGGCSSANTCGGGGSGCSFPKADIYLQWIYCDDGNAWEGWFDGGPEFYFQVAKYDELWTNSDTKIRYLSGVNQPFYSANYEDLQATWGKSFSNTYLFRWQPSYGERLTYVWYEEDTGTQSDQTIRNAAGQNQILSVTWNGQPYSTNAIAFIRSNDDFVQTNETYNDHCSPFIYGSNTFKYKITKQLIP